MITSSDIASLSQKIAARFGYSIKRRRPGIRREGALEFWSDQNDPERFQALECKHGYPSV
jgi:hypothetical protein